jgi:outer membrane protein TolC
MKSYFPTQFPALLTASGATLVLLLSGCAVGPDYKRPVEAVPPQYKAEALGSWKEGRPVDQVPKDAWWVLWSFLTAGS